MKLITVRNSYLLLIKIFTFTTIYGCYNPGRKLWQKQRIPPSSNYQCCSWACGERSLQTTTLKLVGCFSEAGCVMQKNNVLAKIFCPGLSENFKDLVIIL